MAVLPWAGQPAAINLWQFSHGPVSLLPQIYGSSPMGQSACCHKSMAVLPWAGQPAAINLWQFSHGPVSLLP